MVQLEMTFFSFKIGWKPVFYLFTWELFRVETGKLIILKIWVEKFFQILSNCNIKNILNNFPRV